MTELHQTDVHLPGLMQVLGRNLYSTPSVALRELVQNAHDSCVRRRIETEPAFEPRIVLETDPAAGTLTIEDNGAGLTKDEVVRYLATVGQGYTRELRESDGSSDLIGCFGLGFLSAFFVADQVDLYTSSASDPQLGWHFGSRGGERYWLEEADSRPIGTRVVLSLNDESRGFSNAEVVEALLRHHCRLLPFPIHVGQSSAPLNRPEPPWRLELRDETRLRRRALDMEFAQLFEQSYEPLCTFPIEAPEGSSTRGIVWVQGGGSYATSDQRNVSAFVRGMLVDSDARDLLPAWAGFCGAVIESDDLEPTASREDLRRDRAFDETAALLRETILAGLAREANAGSPAWRRVLVRHEESLRGAALCDARLFEALASDIRVPTSVGDLSVDEVLRQSDGKIHVSLGEESGGEEVLFRALMVPVVNGTRYAALPFCHRVAESRNVTVVEVGTAKGNDELFRPLRVDASIQAWMDELLGGEGIAVVPVRFEPSELPMVLVPDREVELKHRLEGDEADRRISTAALGLARLYTENIDGETRARLFVNLSCPLIEKLTNAPEDRRAAAAGVLRSVADLMLGKNQGGLSFNAADVLDRLQTGLTRLMEGE